MNRPRKRDLVLVIAASFLAAGCGDGAPSVSSSRKEVTVKGTVTVQGQPAAGGEISFDPANINRRDASPRQAKIEKDGSYTITTLAGENMVTVKAPKAGVNRKEYVVKSNENTIPVEVP